MEERFWRSQDSIAPSSLAATRVPEQQESAPAATAMAKLGSAVAISAVIVESTKATSPWGTDALKATMKPSIEQRTRPLAVTKIEEMALAPASRARSSHIAEAHIQHVPSVFQRQTFPEESPLAMTTFAGAVHANAPAMALIWELCPQVMRACGVSQ